MSVVARCTARDRFTCRKLYIPDGSEEYKCSRVNINCGYRVPRAGKTTMAYPRGHGPAALKQTQRRRSYHVSKTALTVTPTCPPPSSGQSVWRTVPIKSECRGVYLGPGRWVKNATPPVVAPAEKWTPPAADHEIHATAQYGQRAINSIATSTAMLSLRRQPAPC